MKLRDPKPEQELELPEDKYPDEQPTELLAPFSLFDPGRFETFLDPRGYHETRLNGARLVRIAADE